MQKLVRQLLDIRVYHFNIMFLFSSYTNMSIIVDQLFPSRLEAANDYSQNVYWRDPIPLIEELPEV